MFRLDIRNLKAAKPGKKAYTGVRNRVLSTNRHNCSGCDPGICAGFQGFTKRGEAGTAVHRE